MKLQAITLMTNSNCLWRPPVYHLHQFFASAGYGNIGQMLSCLGPISVSKHFVCGVPSLSL